MCASKDRKIFAVQWRKTTKNEPNVQYAYREREIISLRPECEEVITICEREREIINLRAESDEEFNISGGVGLYIQGKP